MVVLGLFLGLISRIGSPQLNVQFFGLGLIQFHSVAISKCLIFCLILLHSCNCCYVVRFQILIFTKPLFFDLIYSSLYYFLFWEERNIKVGPKYVFTLIFNRGGLWSPNGMNLKWVK